MTEPKKANRGEWSELYAFCRIAQQAELQMCDARLEPLSDQVISVSAIIRKEGRYNLLEENLLRADLRDGNQLTLSRAKCGKLSEALLSDIQIKTGSFASEPGNLALKTFHLLGPKAKSGDKEDLRLSISDPKTRMEIEAGFSLKSYLGNSSTLLNSSNKNTAFRFGLTGSKIDTNEINEISTKSKIKDRLAALIDMGVGLEFRTCLGEIFNRNLLKIDSLMPQILGCLTLANYQLTKKNKKLIDVIDTKFFAELMSRAPIALDIELVKYKMRNLLLDIALGMVPKKDWDGKQRADGGYVVVKEAGDLVCFHVYNFGEFSEYLLQNTRFDSPSSARHSYGHVYEIEGEQFFDVNCQIRFAR